MKNTAFQFDSAQSQITTGYNSNHLLANSLQIKMAEKILQEFMNYRRSPRYNNFCKNSKCQSCSSYRLPKVISAVKTKNPVTFVLPAFPGKSPNSHKVLGPLPDYAERLSLQFLGKLCQKIKKFYSPGIKIILCSDGRVFSDIIGMKESNVTAYQVEINRLIKEMSALDITTYNLDNFYKELSFVQMRDELMKTFGNSLDVLKHKVRNGTRAEAKPEDQEAHRMFCGITRFLFEDSLIPGQTKSRTFIQRQAKTKAYEVIRRSNAWSDLIAMRFPEAVRLSIHPQTCGAKKLGIRLIGNESWMTPWHGVALQTKKGFVLLKRHKAIELGAELIHDSAGRPSHYKLDDHKHISFKGI